MAQPKQPSEKAQAARLTSSVKSALKAVIESDLAREKVAGTKVPDLGAYFSRGIIFSKSGNGTPFSRGIIFSKTGSDIIRPDEDRVLTTLTALDEASFHAFANRLIALKQTKIAGETAAHKVTGIREVQEQS
jgi:hypothetical protein